MIRKREYILTAATGALLGVPFFRLMVSLNPWAASTSRLLREDLPLLAACAVVALIFFGSWYLGAKRYIESRQAKL